MPAVPGLRPGVRLRDRAHHAFGTAAHGRLTDELPHGEDIFYYITLYNEPILQPAQPEGLDFADLLAGLYHFAGPTPSLLEGPRAQLLASGVAVPWALEAQRLLAEDWGVGADVWSATSWTEFAKRCVATRAISCIRTPKAVPYVTRKLSGRPELVVAVSD